MLTLLMRGCTPGVCPSAVGKLRHRLRLWNMAVHLGIWTLDILLLLLAVEGLPRRQRAPKCHVNRLVGMRDIVTLSWNAREARDLVECLQDRAGHSSEGRVRSRRGNGRCEQNDARTRPQNIPDIDIRDSPFAPIMAIRVSSQFVGKLRFI